MKKVFFVDFDGTITIQDTCVAMVQAFAAEGWQQLNTLWEERALSTAECATRTFTLIQANLADLAQMLDKVQIDEAFPRFLQYCREHDYPLYILSDGYDFNLEYILRKYGLEVDFYANHLFYQEGFQIECPYENQECGRCGTCKRTLLEKLRSPGCEAVYIGDGLSDTCPASHSELVFAKGKLLSYCQDKGIPAIPFQGFADILAYYG